MLLSQSGECSEEGTDAGAKETVEWIENQEACVGSLERIFENGWRGDGSAQDAEARGVAIESGEARVNDFGAVVLG